MQLIIRDLIYRSPLKYDSEELHSFPVEGFHAVRTVGIEIKAVSFIQGQLFIPDLQGHTPFEYVVELLPGMGIEIDGGFFVFGFDGNDERVGFTVHETGSERFDICMLGFSVRWLLSLCG